MRLLGFGNQVMMPLKGKGQRAQAGPTVVINIKEPLVVVEGWEGGEEMGGFFVIDALDTSLATL